MSENIRISFGTDRASSFLDSNRAFNRQSAPKMSVRRQQETSRRSSLERWWSGWIQVGSSRPTARSAGVVPSGADAEGMAVRVCAGQDECAAARAAHAGRFGTALLGGRSASGQLGTERVAAAASRHRIDTAFEQQLRAQRPEASKGILADYRVIPNERPRSGYSLRSGCEMTWA